MKISYFLAFLASVLATDFPECTEMITKFPDQALQQVHILDKKIGFTFWKVCRLTDRKTLNGLNNEMLRVRKIENEETRNELQKRVENSKKFSHDQIIQIEKSIFEPDWYYEHNNLLCEQSLKLSRDVKGGIYVEKLNDKMRDVTEILTYVHSKGYVLTNIQAGSFAEGMFEARETILDDYNWAEKIGAAFESRGDFRYWTPHDFLTEAEGRPKVWDTDRDIFQLGMTFYQMAHDNKLPFEAQSKDELAEKLKKGDFIIKSDVPAEHAFIISVVMAYKSKYVIDLNFVISAIELLVETKPSNLKSDISVNIHQPIPAELLEQTDETFREKIITDLQSNYQPTPTDSKFDFSNILSAQFFLILAGVVFFAIILIGGIIWLCSRKPDDVHPPPLPTENTREEPLEITHQTSKNQPI